MNKVAHFFGKRFLARKTKISTAKCDVAASERIREIRQEQERSHLAKERIETILEDVRLLKLR